MRLFAVFNLWLLRWDLDFARNTGRNPVHIDYLRERISEWEKVLFDLDHPLFLG